MIHKKEGFDGQRAIVVPNPAIKQWCLNNAIISNLFITDLGYYPKAKFHYRQRNEGVK